jgi:hypothetical protein
MKALEERLINEIFQHDPERYRRNGSQSKPRYLKNSLGTIPYRFAQLKDRPSGCALMPLVKALANPVYDHYLDEALEASIPTGHRFEKELESRVNYNKLEVLFCDGGPGIEDNLLHPGMKPSAVSGTARGNFPIVCMSTVLKKPRNTLSSRSFVSPCDAAYPGRLRKASPPRTASI